MPRLSLLLSAAFALALAAPAQAAVSGKVKASSVKTDDEDRKVKYTAELAVDGLLTTGWGEGEDGYGEGSWLEIDLGQVTTVEEINLWPGNLSEGKKSFREYSRPRTVRITLAGGGGEAFTREVVLEDAIHRFDLELEAPIEARTLRFDVVDVYEGFVFSDLYIAEAGVNLRQALKQGKLEKLITWLDSEGAVKLADEHEAAVHEAFRKVQAAEFGDPEAFAWIMDQAGDGADYIRPQVPKLVDVGYRAAAVRPDPTALDALRKIKDANGIPAIEMAQLRSWGARQDELQEIVEIFYAYQELIGGPSPNVPYWGQSGWEPGALRSFGEPLPIEVNSNGDLYVADLGNHRVQRFNYQGGPDRSWGGAEPGITNQWFDRGRTWYVSGGEPAAAAGQFINPLDVELIPLKEGEGFAVLDFTKRVQIFDQEGRPLIGWEIRSDAQIDPGVGGEGYLAWLPKRKLLYVFLGNEMIAYNLNAEEKGRWTIQDGTPNGVEVTRNEKFYLVIGREVVLYDRDGFRHGVIWDDERLGKGFEDLDITMDEKRRIWIVTDKGWAYKFKNPRKLEYAVKFSEVSLIRPRIAVQEDILYCVDRDRIIRLDAMQAKLDAEMAAENEAREAAE